ncbi:MAG TPA: DUF2461 domain-containing protein [Candidatus Baltobacteraceae bacterium]|nr:DUF2461 domain-containing protein [Candidatus Baltobacteraceae bacterium]
MAHEGFPGFTPQALQFLVDLGQHNDRAWFQPRKAEYERLLKVPLEALCAALSAEFVTRGIPLASDPAKSPFRIYRDVRFSKDKSPYKTAVSASFPWAGDGGGVGGYLHLQPGQVYVGGGMWHPSPARLAAWRATVVDDRSRVHAVLEEPGFMALFGTLDGERLQRAPAGYRADDPDLDLLRLRDITFGRSLADADAGRPDLPAIVAETLAQAVPLLRLLAELPQAETRVGWLRG